VDICLFANGRFYEENGLSPPVSYVSWLLFGAPHAVLCLAVCYAWLAFVFLGWRYVCYNIQQYVWFTKLLFYNYFGKCGPILIPLLLYSENNCEINWYKICHLIIMTFIKNLKRRYYELS